MTQVISLIEFEDEFLAVVSKVLNQKKIKEGGNTKNKKIK